MLKLYNSLSRNIEDFNPLTEEVKVYSCGPTVYDNIHIGNLSSFIYADLLARVLELDGLKIKHVMNITDVDDKTIARSQERFPEDAPEVALGKLTSQYEGSFKDDISSVGNRLDKLTFIKATESIELMQRLISELLKNGFAYIADDGIYFSIEAYQKNGKKYGQLLELDTANTSKARINNDEYDKQSTHDFVLWKLMRSDEPSWPFEIDGKDYSGRPGWHIECSAMSTNLLGQPFDIHTGGIDLIFPHHENEIAQSTAGKENPTYSRCFFHNEHLLIDKRKMSKSLNNVFSLEDVKQKNLDPLAFRLLILQSHYRSQANFSWEILKAANNRLIDLRNFAVLRYQLLDHSDLNVDFSRYIKEITDAASNDLNIPATLAILSNLQNVAQTMLVGKSESVKFYDFLEFIDNLLGFNLLEIKDINDEQKALLDKRQQARDDQNWSLSDDIRDKLLKDGITVRDSKQGQVWGRI